MIPRDSASWTGWDYIHMLARRLQHERKISPLSYEWLIEIRAYEARKEGHEMAVDYLRVLHMRCESLERYYRSFSSKNKSKIY